MRIIEGYRMWISDLFAFMIIIIFTGRKKASGQGMKNFIIKILSGTKVYEKQLNGIWTARMHNGLW